MDDQTFLIRFENVGVAEAGRLANDLKSALRDVSPEVTVERKRDDETHQDFGATLVLVFGTPVAIAVARRFGDWLVKHRSVTIKIEGKDGKVVASNLTSENATELIGKFLDQSK